MSDVRRLRRNRENRRNLLRRKLEDIERQEQEQKLKREERRAALQSQQSIASGESISGSPNKNTTTNDTNDDTNDDTIHHHARRISSRVGSDDRTRESERIDRATSPSGRLKSPPRWVSKTTKPPPRPAASRFETNDGSSVARTKNRRGRSWNSTKWEDSSNDDEPIRNERRKRSRVMSSPETNASVARTRSRYEVSQSPTMAAAASPEPEPAKSASKSTSTPKSKAIAKRNSESDSDWSFDMLDLFQKNKNLKAKKSNNHDNQTGSSTLDNNNNNNNNNNIGMETSKKCGDEDFNDERMRFRDRRKRDGNRKMPRRRSNSTTSDYHSQGESDVSGGDFTDNYHNVNRNKHRTRNSKTFRKTRIRRRQYSSSDDEHASHDDDSDNSNHDDRNRSSTRRPHRRNSDAASDHESDEGSHIGEDSFGSDEDDNINRNKYRRRYSKPLRKKKIRRRDYSSSDGEGNESPNDDNDDRKTSPTRRRKRRPNKARNPVVLEREAHDQFFFTAMEAKTNDRKSLPPSREDDDDGFMSDCEPVDTKPKKKTATSMYNKRRSSPGESDRTSHKQRRFSERQQDRIDSSCDSSDDYNETQQQKSTTGSIDDLHPEFKDPKFGPYEPMQPLVLSGDQSEITVQVPASLNRYLVPFQKEGIRFMYDCLARKSGVILGDEMGCGKTVQVIALLCSLFNKTGTRKDFEEMRERNSLVRKQKLKIQRLRDKALRMGEVLDEDIEEWKRTSLSLSPWNPVMIIVPPTIMDTWKNAFMTFSHFSVSFYSSKTKTNAIESVLYGNSDILLVPKSAFQNETHFSELERVQWKLIVIDEFHNFKNDKAKISIHLRKLKELHHPLILGMTGTPMQNNHKELWNLVDLVETNYFGTQEEFNMNFDRPITLGRQKSANARVKARSEAASAELRRELGKIYIKRDKKDVLKGQLPDKNEQMILCDLSPLQKEVYKVCMELPDFDLVKHGSRPCDCGINQNFFRNLFTLKCKAEQLEYMRTNKTQIINQAKCCQKIPVNPRHGEEGEPYIDPDAAVWRTLDAHCTDSTAAKEGCKKCPWCCTLPCLTKLNKLSSHLGLLQASTTKEPIGSPAYIRYVKEREFAKVALAGIASKLPGGGYDRHDGIMDDHFSLSGKLRVLDRLLQTYYSEGGKVLLFSHSTQSLGMIQNWLKSRGTYEYRRMDGSTPLSRRQQLTDEFNNDDHIFLFLLSIKATGLGLNLTSANRVIMFDVSWNPSWEIQAQDRAHRIGQTRDVRVVRLISKGTVEEMIYLRQIYKIHLKQDTLQDHDDVDAVAPRVFRGVQGDKYRKGEIFGTENLFRFKEDGSFLDDIWAESRSKGKSDSTGLEIHDSGKLSKILLEMTDDDKAKVRDEDDAVVIQEMSGQDFEGSPDKSMTFSKERTLLDGEKTVLSSDHQVRGRDEPFEKTVRAVNHSDFFRSDKGGAAIASGEDGFDEEMGGQTQAAYEIYENVKNCLVNENGSGQDDDDIIDDECSEISSTQEEKNEAYDNEIDTPSVGRFKDTTYEKTAPISTLLENSTKASNPKKHSHAINISSRDIAVSDRVTLSRAIVCTSANSFSSNNNSNAVVVSTSTQKIHNAEKHYSLGNDPANLQQPKTITRSGTHVKHKVLLMGHTDIDSVKTVFSMTDIRRPNYLKKKKKKRKSK